MCPNAGRSNGNTAKQPGRLVLPAQRARLPEVIAWLEAASVSAAAPDIGLKLQLVAEELFLNVATHAYGSGEAGGEVRLTLFEDPETVILRVEDDGVPFDPLKDSEPPDLEAALEERPVGKLGVFLIRQSSDDQTYERVGGTTNRLDVSIRKT